MVNLKYGFVSVIMCYLLHATTNQEDPPYGEGSISDYNAGNCQIYPYSISPNDTRWVLPRCSYEAQYNKEST